MSCASPTTTNSSLAVALTLDSSVVRASDAVLLRVSASNRGLTPITVNSHGCPYAFTVADRHGVVTGPEGRTCDAMLTIRELSPGDSLVFTYRWVPRSLGHEDTAPFLGPGTYYLRGRIGAAGQPNVSPPVLLRITD